jgi:hypothetical protein
LVKFIAHIRKFGKQGEKTGWTYFEIPAALAQRLKHGNKKTFRVKGRLDDFAIKGVALLPMGGGDFIMPLNAAMRRGTRKRSGASLSVQLELDRDEPAVSPDLMESLSDEPEALAFFNSLTKGHRNYFSKWIESAKTEPTKARRIAQSVNALLRHRGFAELLRSLKNEQRLVRGDRP